MHCFGCNISLMGTKVYLLKRKAYCISCANITSYNFPEFSTKVYNDSSDKSFSAGIEPKHNED